MPGKYKYDIAISAAEEELTIADRIEEALTARNISCYLYTKNIAFHWGENLFKISYENYARDACYVLLLISEIYVKKHWSDMERQIAQAVDRGGEAYILPLRIDDTPVDGISKNIVFVKWQENPEEIADFIAAKMQIRKQKQIRRSIRRCIKIILPLLLIVAGALLLRQMTEKTTQPGNEKRQNLNVYEQMPGVNKTTAIDTKSVIPDPIKVLPPTAVRSSNTPLYFTDTFNKKAGKTLMNPDTTVDYYIVVSGNNAVLNSMLEGRIKSCLLSKGMTVSVNPDMVKRVVNVSLQESTEKSDVAAGLFATSCNYQCHISTRAGVILFSDAGRVECPGFSVGANLDKLSSQLIKKVITSL